MSQASDVDFAEPNWVAPVDLEERLRAMPSGAWVRGMFLDNVANMARASRPDAFAGRRWVAFKSYPLDEFMKVLVEAARIVHARLPVREGLRRLGWEAYPTLFDSMIGRAIFIVAGRSWSMALKLAAKAYEVSLSPGRAQVLEIEEHRAVVALRDIWNFPEAYQVGVFEGAMKAFSVQGRVRVRPLGPCDVDLLLEWE